MSVMVSRSDSLMVLTHTSERSSSCPALCQLLGALCCCPAPCSLSRRLTPHRGGPQAALGALWIITGILHISLGTVLIIVRGLPEFALRSWGPVWVGVLLMLLGVSCVLTERQPRPGLVLLSGLLNLTGITLSMIAFAFYFQAIDNPGFWLFCQTNAYDSVRDAPVRATLSPEQSALLERCEEAQSIMRVLCSSIRGVMVPLSGLDICVGLSSATLSFKALKQTVSNKSLEEEKKK